MHPCRTPLPIGNVSVVDPCHLITAVWSIYSDCNSPTMCSGSKKPNRINIICLSLVLFQNGCHSFFKMAATSDLTWHHHPMLSRRYGFPSRRMAK